MAFRVALLVMSGLLLPTTAASAAQQVELGAGIGTTCRGTDGSVCGDDTGVPLAAHASIFLADRLELGIRVASAGLDDRMFSVTRDGRFGAGAPDTVHVFVHGRSIRYLTGQALYHFRRERRVRPLLGIGVGSFGLPRVNRCEPAGCEPLLELLAGPPEARSHTDVVVTTGLTVRATRHVFVRGGWQAHNFAGDELSSTEWFVAAGWRFGQ